uniref:Uncharacterized protein n=1 Tax=Oryza meridionalis TaxID=40149 RepID=A0A0E0DV32_9ORYZ
MCIYAAWFVLASIFLWFFAWQEEYIAYVATQRRSRRPWAARGRPSCSWASTRRSSRSRGSTAPRPAVSPSRSIYIHIP